MGNASTIRSQVSDEEWQVRTDLAACYRAIAMHGWDDLIFTHVSARVPGPDHHFLINPYGMMFEEITASSLIKVDLAGEKVLESEYEVNPAGFVIHSAVHEVRHDAGCVLHTHTRAGYATLAYHDYEGVALNEEEKPRLVADLGNNNAMILRNHGLLTTGATIADAFLMMYVLETACQIQIMAQSTGAELTQVPAPIVAGIKAQAEQVTKGLGGALVWPGLLRKLDRRDPSFRE